MRVTLLALSVGLATPPLLAAQDGLRRAAATITPEDVAQRIGVIAHDSMAGRDTPSRELELVAAYIAGEFRRLGLRPGGDRGSFLQRYQIQRTQLDTARSTLKVRGGPTLRFGHEVMHHQRGGFAPEGVAGPAVLVTGLGASTDALPDADVSGAVVVAVPATGGTGLPTREADRVLRVLADRGPTAIVIVVDAPDERWRELGRQQLRQSVGIVLRERPEVPWLLVQERALGAALEDAGLSLREIHAAAGGPTTVQPLPRLHLRVTVARRVLETASAPNVVGVLRGSDPRLREEYVIFSAHMDHIGTAGRGQCRALGADSICNGADDDASGTVAVVELAKAFGRLQPRPRRSLIFLTVSGEEHGLWGSDYFAGAPPVPIGQIVANLNLDMVGRNWKDTISVIGKEHSDLGATLNRVNAAHPELGMTAVDDLWPGQSFYTRSDHYNFARRGVPILFFFNGTHPDYHRPTDHPDKIDAEKLVRIAQLVFYLGAEVANAAERPRWNRESYERIVTGSR